MDTIDYSSYINDLVKVLNKINDTLDSIDDTLKAMERKE